MLFNSTVFLVFYILVFILYWIIPKSRINYQNILLLIASYIFYGWWDWRFLSLIAFSTIVDYIIGIAIWKSHFRRKFFLILSICINLGLLGVFKYFNFFIDSWVEVWKLFGYQMNIHALEIILPVGISFYTFQTMSYSIDIYRREIEPTQNFIAFATYVSLFPQLVAGPIERASNLIPQILQERKWVYEKFKDGLFQIGVGFFRKVIVADSIGSLIEGIYNNPEIHNSSSIAMAVLLYSFQIYFDFSGYSDIAIGTAKLLGFEFKPNFNLPYFSTSFTEFWRRWHLSLSSWLRDYLYIPLGGNRFGPLRQYRNLFLTMLLGGLWHGASWNFVIWGGIHGTFLALEKRFDLIPKKYSILKNIIIFIAISIIWIFFRSTSLTGSGIIIKKLVNFAFEVPFIGDASILGTAIYGLIVTLIFDTYLFYSKRSLENIGSKIKDKYFAFIFSIIIINILLLYSNANNFIYFQF